MQEWQLWFYNAHPPPFSHFSLRTAYSVIDQCLELRPFERRMQYTVGMTQTRTELVDTDQPVHVGISVLPRPAQDGPIIVHEPGNPSDYCVRELPSQTVGICRTSLAGVFRRSKRLTKFPDRDLTIPVDVNQLRQLLQLLWGDSASAIWSAVHSANCIHELTMREITWPQPKYLVKLDIDEIEL